MKVAIFDAHHFEKEYFEKANQKLGYELTYFDVKLNQKTASLALGFEVVCPFVNDCLDEKVLEILKWGGIKLVALRSVGVNHVDLEAALRLDLKVVRVPIYSPYAVAEHATALILALDRKIYRSYSRIREGNFSLEGLVGFDLCGKTVGIIGTGRIGSVMVKIMNGFSCNVIAFDIQPNYQLEKVYYAPTIEDLCQQCDIISLHVPLTQQTRHMIDSKIFQFMKQGVMLINTGRGALVETHALVRALKSGKIGYAGLDVYEEEEKIFFQDLSDQGIQDDLLARLVTFPNVIVTAHQGFLTKEALTNIAKTTLESVTELERGEKLVHQVTAEDVVKRKAA